MTLLKRDISINFWQFLARGEIVAKSTRVCVYMLSAHFFFWLPRLLPCSVSWRSLG